MTEACRLNIAGCTIVISVSDDGGRDRQSDVLMAVRAVTHDFGRLTVAALGDAYPSSAEDHSDGEPLGAAREQAAFNQWRWSRGVAANPASGGPPPPVPSKTGTADSADAPCSVAVPPLPPPPPASPRPAGERPQQSLKEDKWGSTLTEAFAHGDAVAVALANGTEVPAALVWPPPQKTRIWVAVGCPPEAICIYGRWYGGAEHARYSDPPCTIRGFPSVGEAKAFARGFVGRNGKELVDRRIDYRWNATLHA